LLYHIYPICVYVYTVNAFLSKIEHSFQINQGRAIVNRVDLGLAHLVLTGISHSSIHIPHTIIYIRM